MTTLVLGGAGSGKSEYAERLILQSKAETRLYLATMRVWDAEGAKRVARHRAARAGKGFFTAERPLDLAHWALPDPNAAVLLEDLGNLLTNEMLDPAGGGAAAALAGVRHLKEQCRDLVIVSTEVFSDGETYDAETEGWRRALADLHRTLAAEADAVCEVVCGVPTYYKGSAET